MFTTTSRTIQLTHTIKHFRCEADKRNSTVQDSNEIEILRIKNVFSTLQHFEIIWQ